MPPKRRGADNRDWKELGPFRVDAQYRGSGGGCQAFRKNNPSPLDREFSGQPGAQFPVRFWSRFPGGTKTPANASELTSRKPCLDDRDLSELELPPYGGARVTARERSRGIDLAPHVDDPDCLSGMKATDGVESAKL